MSAYRITRLEGSYFLLERKFSRTPWMTVSQHDSLRAAQAAKDAALKREIIRINSEKESAGSMTNACEHCGRTDVLLTMTTPQLCKQCETRRANAALAACDPHVSYADKIMAGCYERARRLKPELLTESSDGLKVWLVQHDSQELWLGHWYRMNCTQCNAENPEGGVEFDVREVPGFTEFPRQTEGTVIAHYYAKQRHHADIIAAAISNGWMPTKEKAA